VVRWKSLFERNLWTAKIADGPREAAQEIKRVGVDPMDVAGPTCSASSLICIDKCAVAADECAQ